MIGSHHMKAAARIRLSLIAGELDGPSSVAIAVEFVDGQHHPLRSVWRAHRYADPCRAHERSDVSHTDGVATMGVQRTLMRAANALPVKLYRMSNGRMVGRAAGLATLLLTVAGRKTGVEHTTLVAYFEDDGRYVVTGSAGGSATEPNWFRNLRHADRAVVQIGPTRTEVGVAIADAAEHAVLWARLVARAPGFDKYQAKVERQIPIATLTPRN